MKNLTAVRAWFASLLLTALLAIFVLRPIQLTNSDLGRHLTNGRLLVEGFWRNRDVLFHNFYSFTYPGFPFLNHHWGSGVLFYWIQQVGGFEALSVVYFALIAAAFLLFFRSSRKQSSFGASLAAALIALPLVGYRFEVRPEAFSYFFAAVFFTLLSEKKARLVLPLIMLVWVNLHIQFVLGFGLLGAFLIESFFEWKKDPDKKGELRILSGVMVACLVAGICTPLGYHLLLYPFRIFGNYGYRVAENQSLAFFITRGFRIPILASAYAGFLSLFAATVWLCLKRRGFAVRSALFWIAVAGLVLGFMAIRDLAILGFFGMPVIAQAIDEARARKIKALISVLFFFPGIFATTAYFIRSGLADGPGPEIGLAAGTANSAIFFKANHLRGPIFNNYDIGSDLVYFLFPEERVFVDNRPEAYPASFFENEYIPMQENPQAWQAALAKYRFNCIFFYRLDLTPWGQRFLVARVQDPEWAPVYVDSTTLIFLKRNAENADLIRKFELPPGTFRFKPGS